MLELHFIATMLRTGYNRYDSSGERHTPFRGLPLDGIAVCPAPLQTEDPSIVETFATTSAFVDGICEVPR